jgi:ABC-type transport system involved in multi-copper enzyme maturation permease subunit
MTWLAWRQFRIGALSVFGGLAAFCVLLAITGPDLRGLTTFTNENTLYVTTVIAMYLLPAVLGVFWGVPLVTRELETGTHSLVWNQTVTRRRWLATKLGIGVLAAMVTAGVAAVAISWWASPVDALAAAEPEASLLTRMSPVIFGARGIVPIGYAALAFVLGIAVGMVLRRTVAAMAVTLVAFAAVTIAVPFLVRPYLLPATEEAVTISPSNIQRIIGNDQFELVGVTVVNPAGGWVLVNETVDRAGDVVSPLPEAVQDCAPPPPGTRESAVPDHRTMTECLGQLSDLGLHQRVVYHPASQFWPLQLVETAIYLGGAALLGWFCFRRLRHLS